MLPSQSPKAIMDTLQNDSISVVAASLDAESEAGVWILGKHILQESAQGIGWGSRMSSRGILALSWCKVIGRCSKNLLSRQPAQSCHASFQAWFISSLVAELSTATWVVLSLLLRTVFKPIKWNETQTWVKLHAGPLLNLWSEAWFLQPDILSHPTFRDSPGRFKKYLSFAKLY